MPVAATLPAIISACIWRTRLHCWQTVCIILLPCKRCKRRKRRRAVVTALVWIRHDSTALRPTAALYYASTWISVGRCSGCPLLPFVAHAPALPIPGARFFGFYAAAAFRTRHCRRSLLPAARLMHRARSVARTLPAQLPGTFDLVERAYRLYRFCATSFHAGDTAHPRSTFAFPTHTTHIPAYRTLLLVIDVVIPHGITR